MWGYLAIAVPGRPLRIVPLKRERLVVGRSGACDVVVDDPFVSRLHALLSWSASGLWVADLGSRNGTHVNGQRLVGPARLRPGDRLVLGRTQAACLLAASEGSPAGPVAGPERQRR